MQVEIEDIVLDEIVAQRLKSDAEIIDGDLTQLQEKMKMVGLTEEEDDEYFWLVNTLDALNTALKYYTGVDWPQRM
tara:strand:- start:193 stop:420 length:228 start_codon:yes stop_codon:yes gene_type:complete